MRSIFWALYTKDEKHVAIHKIQKAVSSYGDIVDSKLFSDLSLSMTIEIKESDIDHLYNELKQIAGINSFDALHSSSGRERTIYLNITFGNGTGDVRVVAPSVPG